MSITPLDELRKALGELMAAGDALDAVASHRELNHEEPDAECAECVKWLEVLGRLARAKHDARKILQRCP